jgi:hypothetical protein
MPHPITPTFILRKLHHPSGYCSSTTLLLRNGDGSTMERKADGLDFFDIVFFDYRQTSRKASQIVATAAIVGLLCTDSS